MIEEKIEIDEIKKGLGIIANVMLLGQSTQENFLKTKENGKMFESLCSMTESYTRVLEDKMERWEAEERYRQNIALQAMETYAEGRAIIRMRKAE